MNPIAYTYDADVHCPDCAKSRFGRCTLDGDIACTGISCGCENEDSEGNPPGAVFGWDEFDTNGLYCGDCGSEIMAPYEAPEPEPLYPRRVAP
jgi:hypothetical protein